MTLFARRRILASAGYSVIDAQLVVRGDLTTAGTIRIDGRMEGSVPRADVVVVGGSGLIIGDIDAREVIVAGTIHGSVSADERIEVQASGRIHGDVRAPALALHEGGVVHGHLCIEGGRAYDDTRAPRFEFGARRAVPTLPG